MQRRKSNERELLDSKSEGMQELLRERRKKEDRLQCQVLPTTSSNDEYDEMPSALPGIQQTGR